jgi:hypothetical protein
MAIELRWREDFGGAAIVRDESFLGVLRPEHWWTVPEGDPSVAWVAGFLNAETEEYVKVCVELPAEPVSAERAPEVLQKARLAIAAGPPAIPEATKIPAGAEFSAEEVYEQLNRVISAWVQALDDLERVAEQRDPSLAYTVWVKLMHVLNWAYTADSALQAAWKRVPEEQQVCASEDADANIQAAIRDWEHRRSPDWKPDEEAAFRPYVRRQLEPRIYKDWASVIGAGAFHEEFFDGLAWISGKMRHHQAAEMPIELRQMTPGGEPRWKWKLADAIAAKAKDRDKARSKYVAHLQENDVLGLLSWLVDVFVDAEMLLVRLMREAEEAS